MSERREVFGFAELNRLTCACGQCKTEVVFDLSTDAAKFGDECPGCGGRLDPMDEVISMMRATRKKILAAKLKVTLSANG